MVFTTSSSYSILQAKKLYMRLFVVLIAFAFLWVACASPKAFEYRDFKDFKVENVGFNKSRVSMNLVYYNPNNFGVQLKKINCDIWIENKYLGKFLLDTSMTIARQREFNLPANIDVDMRNLFKNAFSALFGKELLVTVKGTARVGKGNIFINAPVSYEGKHSFSF
jgi:LEA14-like dessication related protein